MADNKSGNLSLDFCGGSLAKSPTGAQLERYASIKQCAEYRGIPTKLLSRARQSAELPHHGFGKDGTIKWDELQPYLVANLPAFSIGLGERLEERDTLELRKLKAEVVKLENYNKTKSKDFISRKLVLQTIGQLYSNVFAQLSRYLLQEMPAKCDGMTANQLKQYNKDYLGQLLSSLKYQESLWSNADDVTEESNEV